MEPKDYVILILFTIVVAQGIWLSVEIKSPEYREEIKRDSTTTVQIDSIPPPDTVRVIEPEVQEPDTVIDSVVVTNIDNFRTEPDNELSKFRRYTTSVTDSLLTGTIKTTVQGYLVSQNFHYTPEYPIVVNVNTNTTVTETVTRTLKPKGYPSFGVRTATDFQSIRGIEVTGSWTFQNGNRITYGYNPALKYHSVGISYNLRNLFR